MEDVGDGTLAQIGCVWISFGYCGGEGRDAVEGVEAKAENAEDALREEALWEYGELEVSSDFYAMKKEIARLTLVALMKAVKEVRKCRIVTQVGQQSYLVILRCKILAKREQSQQDRKLFLVNICRK